MIVFWTYRHLRTRLNKKVSEFELAALRDQSSTMLIGEAQGARWRRLPDGSWQRWSYLGNDWEKAVAPPALLEAATANLAVTEWTAGPDGSWRPYDPDAARIEETTPQESTSGSKPDAPEKPASRELPPATQQPDPDYVPRPEWTADWKPGWNDDLKPRS
ncbi:MAG: hypothetical protein ACXVQX_10905 [Actinomycetota bacterium]